MESSREALDADAPAASPRSRSSSACRFVDGCMRAYAALPPAARALVESAHRRECAVRWVLDSNRLEHCGTQDLGSTRAALLRATAGRSLPESETVATMVALELLFARLAEKRDEVGRGAEREERLDALLQTVDGILELHGALLAHEGVGGGRAGTYRTGDAHPGDAPRSLYCTPSRIETELYAAVDAHNSAVRALAASGDAAACATSSAVGVGARLLHAMLRVHPFGDGNGRLARLLLAATLHGHHPVALSIPITTEADRLRYLEALRAADEGGPAAFDALVAVIADASVGLWTGVRLEVERAGFVWPEFEKE